MSTSLRNGLDEPLPTAAERSAVAPPASATEEPAVSARPREIGGASGPDPTRFGDWEKNGRCIDF